MLQSLKSLLQKNLLFLKNDIYFFTQSLLQDYVMNRELFHIYGPLSINSFGAMIALGIAVFSWLLYRDSRRKSLLPNNVFFDIVLLGTLMGVTGARLICIISDWSYMDKWTDLLRIWQGGYSMLGALLGVLIFLSTYLYLHKLPVLATLDLFAVYAPLMQAIAKMGCLFAGCCYGRATTLPWGITYTDPYSIAPIGIRLHPTQIYTVIILLGIFLYLYGYAQYHYKRAGQLIYTYLIFACTERFFLDFLRDDRFFFKAARFQWFSMYQWVALSIMVGITIAYFLYHSRVHHIYQRHESV